MQGDYAYVAAFHQGIRILDVSDPTQPGQVALVPLAPGTSRVDAAGNYAYASVEYAVAGPVFWVIDVTNPGLASVVGQLPGGVGGVSDMIVRGSYVYATSSCCSNDGLLNVVDVSIPTNPVLTVKWSTGISTTLALWDDVGVNVAVIAAKEKGMRVVNLSDPHNPVELASHEPVGYVFQLALAGEYLAVTRGSGELWMINTADPDERYAGGPFRGYAESGDIVVRENYAYVTNCDWFLGLESGLQIFDLSNALNPREVSFFQCCLQCLGGLDVEGNYAFVREYTRDFFVVDISDPANPTQIGTLDMTGDSYAVCANGATIYLADGDDGLDILDVSTPSAPFVAGHCDFDGSARDVAYADGYAFVAGGDPRGIVGLWVVDVSDPSNPSIAAQFETNSLMTHITIRDEYAYLSSGTGPRLFMIDISNPTDPTEVGYIDAGGIVSRVAVKPPYIYAISDMCEEVLVFRSTALATGIENPKLPSSVAQLEQNYPNPFNPSTTISFTLVEPSHVNLSIYDVRGDRVTTLLDQLLPAGRNEISWNGRDSEGKMVGSGVYFCRLNTEGSVSTKKILFLK